MGIHLREREAQEKAKMAQEALGNQGHINNALVVSVHELMQRVTAAEVLLTKVLEILSLSPDDILNEFVDKHEAAVKENVDVPVVVESVDE